MRFISFCVLGALTFGLARCEAQPIDGTTTTKPAESSPGTTRDEFLARWKTLNEQGDWTALHQLGRDWQAGHPDDSDALYAQGLASYMLGDLDSATTELEKFLATNPADARNAKSWLDNVRAIKHNFPDLQLKPLQLVTSDVTLEQIPWVQKGAALLGAKRYDEIEKTAAALQKSNEADIKGTPYLRAFFDGLLHGGDTNFAALQGRIAAWRAARPKSNLARLAALEMWTDAAYKARGTGFASTITPAMEARMDAAIQKGAQTLKTLPKTAFDSPLAFEAVVEWGSLAGVPRDFFDHFFQEGTAKFPNYLPLYTRRARILLPRWYGEPGEWEAMARKRADQIGGENGTVFYARVVWSLSQIVSDLPKESKFDYKRARRGLEILQKRQPDSLAVASARLDTAIESEDWPTAKQVLASPQGFLLDRSWWRWKAPQNFAVFPETRMWILSDQTPQ